MKSYQLYPRDVLFFRDGRPIDRLKDGAGDIAVVGHGAFWPRPDHLYNAVMHALLGSRSAGRKAFGTFGDLQVAGPFPVKGGELYLPRPLDWKMGVEPLRETNAPAWLTHGFIDDEEGKKNYPTWIPLTCYKAYLDAADRPSRDRLGDLKEPSLFAPEIRTGTTMDPATGASKRNADQRSGQYQAEYLRLERGVSMACEINPGKTDVETPRAFIMGGQGGMVSAEPSGISLEASFPVPAVPEGEGPFYLRWTLLAPAYFAQTGWLPGWCKDTNPVDPEPIGHVKLPNCDTCRLIGACTGKPIVFSGWDSEEGIKPTVLAVPAGSVYLFECPERGKAEALVRALHLTRKSDFGSQGFGMGVCSFVRISR